MQKNSIVQVGQNSLADYVRRVRREKAVSTMSVSKKSGGAISDGYVSRIENSQVKNVSLEKLRALAKGLDVSEEEVFAVARGHTSPADENILKELKEPNLRRFAADVIRALEFNDIKSLHPDLTSIDTVISSWVEELELDRDWPSDLHPADVLDKYIFPQIQQMLQEEK